MKNILLALYKFFNILQTVLVWIAFFCIAIWFYRLINLSYDGSGFFLSIVEYVPNIVRGIIPYMADFAGRPIDVSYFPAAIILFILHMIIKAGILEAIEKMLQECLKQEYQAKQNEENKVNDELKEDLKINVLEYAYFAGILDLEIENPMDRQHFALQEIDTDGIRHDNFKSIINDLKQNFAVKCEIFDDKVVLLGNNFATFDSFLFFLIDKIKAIYRINRNSSVITRFTLSFDASTKPDLRLIYKKSLEKISSFKYYNKIIATTLFASRYKYCNHPKFDLNTMGVSRYFRKTSGGIGDGTFETEDFDLYSLSIAKD